MNIFLGDQKGLKDFVEKVINGEEVCPSRADSQKRKVVEYLVKNFLNADFFQELYDDPLSYFTNMARNTDLVTYSFKTSV